MQRGEELYSGKAKSVYTCDRDDALILHFRNDTSAFDGEKIEQLDRKGMVNNKFNAFIMQYLEEAGVATHYLELLSDNETLVRRLDMFPIECVVRNIATGSICKRLGVEDGLDLFELLLAGRAIAQVQEHLQRLLLEQGPVEVLLEERAEPLAGFRQVGPINVAIQGRLLSTNGG